MEPRKQRLMPWLYQRIEDGMTPGLFWIDKSQLIFQMPWVHAKKKSYDMDRDAALYKSWALNSGKYLPERDEPDPTTWKINFRCALNSLKGHINLVKTDEIEGYRRMQFSRQALNDQLELDQARNIGRKLLDMHGGQRRSESSFNSMSTPSLLRNFMEPGSQSDTLSICDDQNYRVHGSSTPAKSLSRSDSSLSSPESHTTGEIDDQRLHVAPGRCPSQGSENSEDSGLDEIEFIGSLIDQLTESPAEISYDTDICIFYYNKEVMRFRVSNPRGCRIYWPTRGDDLKLEPEEHDRFFGSHLRTQIALPDPVYDTPPLRKLLKSMQRGILLDMSNNDLYATQYGRCSVYCNDTRMETTDAGKLGRYEKTKVFDFRGLFTPHFENHCAKLGGCPSTELFFTFGQKWHHSRPAEENILSFTVTHSLARNKVQRRQHTSTTKLHLQLEIDKPTNEDEYVNILLGFYPPYSYSSSAMQSSLM
ncbi:interferon regulatory factor 4-like isoform X2 [Corticium candelabrum]|uniref:interferon regulatory factor 4-like isoform X2 n=1 Tax=Corticium candelabrum TaxID=121492 RepID=UPI002E259AF2|nr:interferon regulatory factor 4-like isoform X2 [Corticium candelabrum]